MSFWIILGVVTLAYVYALNKYLNTPNPAAAAYAVKPPTDEELAKVTVPTLDDITKVIKADGEATGEAYVVVGGAGLVGQYIVRALLARGETLIRIIDVVPPDLKLYGDASAADHISRAEFVKADITNYDSIKEAISRPFGDTGRTADVVIHTVAVIRNAERLAYLKHLSYRVNVDGTRNVLKASQELGSVRALVFTSSVGLLAPVGNFLRLGLFGAPRRVLWGDDIPEDALLANNHYLATKLEGDKMIRAADGVKGVRTGVLRPGMAITGPQSIFYSFYFTNPGPFPAWGGKYTTGMVNPWDLARAHILMSDALLNRPNDVAGQAFAVTGQPTAHSFDEMRRMFKSFSHRGLKFQEVPVLGFYILSHLFELFFFARYLWLKALFKITGRPVTYLPQWAVDSKASFLQPAMWDLSLVDAIIDDSRIRKVLGYRNYWSTAQTIKWTVDTLEGRTSS